MFSFELEWSRESYFSFIDKKRCWQRKLPWEWVKSGDADCGVLVKRYKWSVAECQEWNPRFGNSVLFLTPRLLFTLVYSVFSKLPCTFPNWGQNPIHLLRPCLCLPTWNSPAHTYPDPPSYTHTHHRHAVSFLRMTTTVALCLSCLRAHIVPEL